MVKVKLLYVQFARKINTILALVRLYVELCISAASYRGPGEDEGPDHYAARIAFTGNSRILGPACIVVGFIMLVMGIVLCLLTRRARRREQRIGFHCPLHGDFYPLSPITSTRTLGELYYLTSYKHLSL